MKLGFVKNLISESKFKLFAGIVLSVAVLFFAMLATITQVSAATTKVLPYQGKLTNIDGTNIADGNYNFQIFFYDASSAGTCVYTLKGTCGSPTNTSIAVANGIFYIPLGDTTALAGTNALSSINFNQDLWMEVKIGTETLTPRKRVTGSSFVSYSNLTDPTSNTALSFGSNTSTFTWGATTSTSDLFNITDTNSNTGTGRLVNITTGTSSTLNPFRIAAAGTEAIFVKNTGNVSVGSTTATSKFNVGSSGGFQVDTNGNIVKINGVTYSFPASIAAANYFLKTDAGGNLTWDQALQYVYNSGTVLTGRPNINFTGTGVTCVDNSGSNRTDCTIPGGGSARLDQLLAATNSNSIDNTNFTQTWNWSTLATGTGLSLATNSTALTTGNVFNIGSVTFNPGAGSSGSAQIISLIQGGNNTSGNAIANGLNIFSTLNTSGATGTKELNAYRVNAPTLTGCTGGNCTWNGFNVNTQATGAAATITQNGLNINAAGIAAGSLNGVNISNITGGAGTETAITIGTGWDNAISGSGFSISGTGALTVASCSGCGGGTARLDQITAATATPTAQDNTTFSQTWNWSTLTTQTAFSLGTNTTGITTGGILNVGGGTTAFSQLGGTNTASLVSLSALNSSAGGASAVDTANILDLFANVNSSAATGTSITTNGLNVRSTINTTGAVAKAINGINIAAPTNTACTGGACTWTGLNIADPGTLANTTFYAATFQGGNVGIGTATPATKLDIQGGELRVKSLSSGYAFKQIRNDGAVLFSIDDEGTLNGQARGYVNVSDNLNIAANKYVNVGAGALSFYGQGNDATTTAGAYYDGAAWNRSFTNYLPQIDYTSTSTTSSIYFNSTNASSGTPVFANRARFYVDGTVSKGGQFTIGNGSVPVSNLDVNIQDSGTKGSIIKGASGQSVNIFEIQDSTTAALYSIGSTGNVTNSANGAASNSALRLAGTIYASGTGTTNFPQLLVSPSGATAVTTWSTAGTAIGVNTATGFTGNFFDFHVNGGASVASLTSAGALTVASCTGCGGGSSSLNSITAATGTATLANANNAIVWNWGTLTTQTGFTIGGGTAMTTGSIFAIGAGTYVHTTAETGSASTLSFTDASTNASGATVTNGLLNTITLNTSGAGTKTINGENITLASTPTCTTGACTVNLFNATTLASGPLSTITQNGLNINATGISAGTLNGINISNITGGAGTETALKIGTGYDNSILGAGALTIATTSNTNISLLPNGTGTVIATSATVSGNAATINANSVSGGNGLVINANAIGLGTGILLNNNSAAASGAYFISNGGSVFDIESGSSGGANLAKISGVNFDSGTFISLLGPNGGTSCTTCAAFSNTKENTGGFLYNHGGANEVGNVFNVAYTDGSSGGFTGVQTNAFNVGITLNTSAAGTKTQTAYNVTTPILTGCATGACTLNGFLFANAATGAASTITQNGINIAATGISAGALNGVNIGSITGGAGTETAILIGSGWDNQISGNGFSVSGTGALTVASCSGCGGGATRLDQITSATSSPTALANANFAQTWNWGTLTTQTGFTIGGGTAMTTGSTFSIGSSTFVHTAAETGVLENNSFTDSSTATSGTTNTIGLQISPTVNVSGAATKNIFGVNVPFSFTQCSSGNCNVAAFRSTSPTIANTGTNTITARGLDFTSIGGFTQNTGAGTLNFFGTDITLPNVTQTTGTIAVTGYNVTTGTNTTGGTQTGLNIAAQGVAAGTLNGINISNITAGAGTETALKIGTGYDNSILGAGALTIATTSNTNISLLPNGTGGVVVTSAASTTNAFSITDNSISSGSVLNLSSSASWSTGNVLTVVGNSSSSGDVTSISGTSQNSGSLLTLNGSTVLSTGSLIKSNATGFNHGVNSEEGSAVLLDITDFSNGSTTGTISNILKLSSTLATSTAGTKAFNAILIPTPTKTSCTTGACTWTGLNIANTGSLANATFTPINYGAGLFTVDSAGVTTVKNLIISGQAGSPATTSGLISYDTTANKFKIVESGTVKILCNTTDAGCGAGGSTRIDQLLAATATPTAQDNTTFSQTWNWSTLTTQTAFSLGTNTTGATTGTILNIGNSTTAYNPGAGNTGSLVSLGTSNSGTNTSGAATVNVLNLNTTNNTSGATGTKTTNTLNISAPTLTACTGGACTINGINAVGGATTSNYTQNLLNLSANSYTTDNIATISGTGITTGNALKIILGTGSATTGSALLIMNQGSGGAAYNPGGSGTGSLVNFRVTNAGTNTSGSNQVNGLNIDTFLNTSGATGGKSTNAINISAPTFTACTGGPCVWTGLNIADPATTNANISANAIYVGGGNFHWEAGATTFGATAGFLPILKQANVSQDGFTTATGINLSAADTGASIRTGINNSVTSSTTNLTLGSTVYGIESSTNLDGVGTVAENTAGYFLGGAGSGTFTDVRAINAKAVNTGATGSVTNLTGIYIASSDSSSSANTLSNIYGLYVDDQTLLKGAATNNYNIYSAGAASTNYFAGSNVIAGAGAASDPAELLSGAILTGGTGTTNFPQFYIKPTAASAVTTWSTNGTAIGVNTASGFTGNFFDFYINGGTSVAKLTSGGALTVSSCTGCGGGGSSLSGLTAATSSPAALANANFAQTWNWGTLTTQTGMTFGGGTAMTTGGVFAINGGTYVHTTAETGTLHPISFTDASTNASGATVTNGILNTITLNTSGAGTKTINGVNSTIANTPTCTSGACTVNYFNATTLASGPLSTITQNGVNIAATGISAGTLNGINISGITPGAGIETGISLGQGWDFGFQVKAPGLFTQTTTLRAIDLDFNTNFTGGDGLGITGLTFTPPTSGAYLTSTTSYTGINIPNPGATYTTIGGTLNYKGISIINPGITQTSGTATATTLDLSTGSVTTNGVQTGIKLTTSSITTNGTQNGISINASGVGVGTLTGINISNITAGAGTENAITIGSGWDKQINGTGWSVDATGNITVLGCTGCGGGGSSLSGLTAATSSPAALANANFAQTWNWGTLTTQTGMTFGGGTAMTTGGVFAINGGTYVHTTAETGTLHPISFTDASTNASGATVTNGILNTITLNTSGAGTKTINGVNSTIANTPTCTSGACTVNYFNATTLASGPLSTITQNGVNIAATGISAGTLNGINIGNITAGAGTETALNIGTGWDTAISFGGAILPSANKTYDIGNNTNRLRTLFLGANSGIALDFDDGFSNNGYIRIDSGDSLGFAGFLGYTFRSSTQAVTGSQDQVDIFADFTSSTASIAKIGLNIQSTGTFNGTSATNTGLVVNATGGTTNYAAAFSGGNVGIGTTTPNTGALQVTTAGAASKSALALDGAIFTGGTGTTNFPALFIQPSGTTASTTWSTAGTAIGANLASGFTGNFVDFNVAGVDEFNVNSAGNVTGGTYNGLTLASASSTPALTNGTVWYNTTTNRFNVVEGGASKQLCNATDLACGTGSGAAISALTAATVGNTIANANFAQVWNWGTLTTQTGLNLGGGTAMTTGTVFAIGGSTFIHTTNSEIGYSEVNTFTDASTIASGTSNTNGNYVGATINATSGAGTRNVQAFSSNPTLTACSAGACNYTGYYATLTGTGAAAGITQTGLNIAAAGVSAGAVTGINIGSITGGAGTEVAVKIGNGWDTQFQIAALSSDPPTPPTDNLDLYVKKVAGRSMLKAKGPSGVDYIYQPSLFQQLVILMGTGGGTTIGVFGTTVTSVGTVSHPANTEVMGYMVNQVSGNVANNTAGTGEINAPHFRGSTAGANGFFFSARIYAPDASYGTGATGARFFVGLTNQTMAASVGSDNVASSHHAGFQFSTNRGDTNWQFVTKDGTTQAQADTSMAFAVQKVYDMYIYVAPQGTTIYWRIDNETDNTTQEGNTGSNLPGGSTGLRAGLQIATLTTTARNIRYQRIYVESDR